MPDRPATPEEKLYLRLQQAKAMGKGFEESLERRILGLPPVEGRDPIVVPEAPSRRLRVVGDDTAGLAELEEEARALQEEAERSRQTEAERRFQQAAAGNGQAPAEEKLRDEAENASLRDLEEQLAQERRRREELEAQVEELRGEGPKPATTAAVSAPGEAQQLVGMPDESWTKREMLQYLAQEGLPPFPGNPQFTRKAELLEWVREHAGVTQASA